MTFSVKIIVTVVTSSLLLMTGCGRGGSSDTDTVQAVTQAQSNIGKKPDTAQNGTTEFVALDSDTAIPYPIYPNAKRYRVGGENGLKIVVFETPDGFADVDAFFKQSLATQQTLARQEMMADYVKYAPEVANAEDQWRSDQPGIVIHQFADATEAANYGAGSASRTNIIMSFH